MMHWGIMGHFRTLGPLGPSRHYEMQLLGACWKARYCGWKIFYQWDKYLQVAAHRPIKCTPKCQKVRKMAFLAGGRLPFGPLGPTVMVTTLLFFVCHKTHGRCTCRTTWNIFKIFFGILLPLLSQKSPKMPFLASGGFFTPSWKDSYTSAALSYSINVLFVLFTVKKSEFPCF